MATETPARRTHKRGWGWECIVDGCPNVEYRHEVCHRHWREIPQALRDEMWIASFRASIEASRSYDPQIRELAKVMKPAARGAGT